MATILAHITAHHVSSSPHLGDVCESIRLEWVDPIADASPLPETNLQAPPIAAGELTLKYTRLHAPAIADWWAAHRVG